MRPCVPVLCPEVDCICSTPDSKMQIGFDAFDLMTGRNISLRGFSPGLSVHPLSAHAALPLPIGHFALPILSPTGRGASPGDVASLLIQLALLDIG